MLSIKVSFLNTKKVLQVDFLSTDVYDSSEVHLSWAASLVINA